MSRTFYALLLLVALAPAAFAQPVVDGTTGLDPSAGGIGQEKLYDYLRTVESATTTLTWDTAGDSRRDLGANRMVFDLKWAWDERRGEPVIVGGEIRPAGGSKSFKVGDMEVYKLKINKKGEIRVERPGIDTTIYKMTKKANGDIEVDIPWLHDIFADTTIPAETFGPFEITNWPPSMEDVLKTVSARGAEKDPNDTTRHEGTFNWHFHGRARPHRFPVSGGAVTAATAFDVRGTGRLSPDGTFKTIGDNNSAKLTVNVGGTRYARDNGALSADLAEGTGTFNGNYAINIPDGRTDDFVMNVEGDLSYRVRGRDVTLNVPSGAKIVAGDVTLAGDGRLVAGFRPSGGNMALEDGTYTMDLDGPLAISGLKVDAFDLKDLKFDDVDLSSTGRVEEFGSDGLKVTGDWDGVIEGNARGAANVLLGKDGGHLRANVGSGTRAEVDLDDVTIASRFPKNSGEKHTFDMNAHGNIRGAVEVEDGEAKLDTWTLNAPSATTTFDLDVDASTADGITNARGSINTTLNEAGRIEYGLPSEAPVLPSVDSFRRHRVESGDSLSKIAKAYGVSVPRLRDANGMGSGDSLIRVGDVLKIPGAGPSSASSKPLVASSTVEAGSNLNLELESASVNQDGVSATGYVTSTVRLETADLASGSLEAKILGAASASLARTRFDLREGPDGRSRVKIDDMRVPVRLDLNAGSKIVTSEGAMNVEIDKDGSYAEFTAHLSTGPDGKLRIDSLEKADLLLHSNGAASFAGRTADVTGEKTIRYEGRMVFVERGIDFFGDITVRVRGDEDTPAVRIRW